MSINYFTSVRFLTIVAFINLHATNGSQTKRVVVSFDDKVSPNSFERVYARLSILILYLDILVPPQIKPYHLTSTLY